ncbi:hypothetical protein BDA96_09G215300 [Sorghum bicolor]|uniref:Uncharacterized protein n=2 Tax=Sorghum bicolor TaxID=4558 RepID=A0A921QBS2_SORBI|nr:hypothetical protein BDA96_09G215300 [Sorghum bicolor]KXG22377.1 hypothetical protein SORBI_3009G204000 [Sorghum bicolor]
MTFAALFRSVSSSGGNKARRMRTNEEGKRQERKRRRFQSPDQIRCVLGSRHAIFFVRHDASGWKCRQVRRFPPRNHAVSMHAYDRRSMHVPRYLVSSFFPGF